MTRRVICLTLALALCGSCARIPKVSIGRRGEPTRWDAAGLENLAFEIESLVVRSSTLPEDQIVQQVGTELEFGEEEVDPAVLTGALEDLEYEIPALAEWKIATPEVAAAIRARQLRAISLREWKKRGCLGESERGLLVYVACEPCEQDPVQGERLSFIIIKENRNRRGIYTALLRTHRWPNSRAEDVGHTFGRAHHDLALPTDYLEDNGQWVRQREPADARAQADAIPTIGRQRRSALEENWDDAQALEGEWESIPPRPIPRK